jgi:hypothetical protein
MNEFTAQNEQAFLDACGAIGAEPNAMIEPHKERYLVSEFLKDPLSWLQTELLYYSYTTPGEAQEVANSIDRFTNEGGNNGPVKALLLKQRDGRIGGKAMRETISGEAVLSLLIKSCGSKREAGARSERVPSNS